MNFGFSVGDFVTIGNLAWNVYKSCKGAPESFGNISHEVLSLHAVLKETEETAFVHPLSPTRQANLKTVGDGCYRVLEDLQTLVKKYERLGTRSKRTWDRMGWGTEDIVELRSRLTSNTVLLTAFIRCARAARSRSLSRAVITILTFKILARLKPMSKRNWMILCKNLRTENTKAQFYPVRQ